MNNRRYFIVYFTGQNEKKQQQRGKIHMFVENDGFINEKFIHEKIINDFGLTDPYIENVMELDEADFYDFISEDYPHKEIKPDRDENDYEELL